MNNMKKLLFAIVAIATMGFMSISCASHTTYQTVNESSPFQAQGTFKRCTACDGKGSCSACKGTGRISGDACRNCKGSGKCPSCRGDGGYYVYD